MSRVPARRVACWCPVCRALVRTLAVQIWTAQIWMNQFDMADHAALLRSRDQVPGTDSGTILLAVSRTGIQAPGADIALGPTDLLDAWR